MLGTKEGTTLTEFENKISLLGDTNSTAYESIGLKTHLFDSASLKKLAKDSTQDIYSQNYSMKKAFPTFKLYFVEEDEIENRLLSYDDFFSYNGVKDFSVVISRKNSADVAVISLQNVSGSLDGTKRDAISDVDYFTTPLVNKDVKAEDINTSNEQKFDAVLLRPGMNVQLRVGYSNDPRNLEVLISGRVVDITWNKSGDLSEIMVQGFGAELEQVLRGTATDDDKDIYFSTHQLLGSLMLSPELVHFGRWEIGQEFQIGEAKDSRIDFTDYARPGLSSIFSLTQTLADFFMENIGFSIFLFSAVSLFNILPVSGVLSKSAKPGIASGIYGIVDNATSVSTSRSRQIIKNIVTSAVNKVKNTKVGVYATSATRSSIDALSQRASMFSMSSSNAWRPVVGEIIESRNIEKAVLQKGIDGLVESVGGEAQLVQLLRERVMLKLAALLDEQVVKGSLLAEDTISIAEKFDKSFDQIINAETLKNYQSIDELVSSLAKTTSVVRNRIFAAKLFGKIDYRILETPLDVFKAESDFTAAKAAEEIIQIGSRGVGGYLKAMRATGIVALAIPFQTTGLGVAWYFLRDSILEVRNKFLRAYETTKVSFMLSPQDDNIFAPHPKDYMDLKKRSLPEKVKLAAARGIGNVVGDTSTGIMFARWVDSERNIFDKRVLPCACKYVLDNSTIWDVFNEMSLRHPGWVYSPRPYGTSFRYTMFFGVPSQRYWSKPASKEFIRRMNKLDSAIKILSAGNDLSPAVINDLYPKWREDNQYINLTENEAKSMVQAQVLQEYLRGLDLRFTPFRKHHKISSDRDLVWNGIMSSENAANNAVAVTYFSEDANIDLDENPIATEVFKAHSRIPEHMVRVMPLRPYRGCRGQAMAVRYAMGALMDAMKDIYRGEILVVGNSKIRPYDICILMDEYNDITGPIEVEQVVHMFSHERGFLTEIKPSAVVFANEISSWPLIEAAKMTSLAVKQIEDQVGEMARFGVLNYALRAEGAIPYTVSENEVAHLKNKFNSNLSLQKVVAGVIPGIMDNASLMNEFEEFDKAIKEVVDMANDTAKISLVSATPLSGIPALAFRENILFAKKSFIKPPTALGMVQTLLLFAQASREDAIVIVPLLKSGRPIVSNLGLQDPSLAWTSIRGQLRRLVDDTISGTAEMASLLSTYGDSFWKHVLDTDFSEASQGVGGPFQ